MQLSTHFLFRILLTGTLLFLAGMGHAQPVPRGEAVFMGVKKSDRVGPASAIPDGKPDAVFVLTLKPRPAEPIDLGDSNQGIRRLTRILEQHRPGRRAPDILALPEPRNLRRSLTAKQSQ